jgi:aspartate-semialdehyde dehydrogenase
VLREVTMQPFRVAILGATGLVGQRLVERLANHPWFRVTGLAASDRSAGRSYADAVIWRLSDGPPAHISRLALRRCAVPELEDCDVALSALDAAVAREVEPRFAEAGIPVVSNSSAFRQDDAVPLLVPEVNPAHLGLLDRPRREGAGFIVTNPNCSTTGLALALAPLHRAFGVRRVVVSTLQAVSGAGVDGPRALDLVDNVIPHIPGEEEKIERELGKILGAFDGARVARADLAVSAHCHRVPTLDGHLEAVSVGLDRKADLDELREALRSFRSEVEADGLPSACAAPIVVRDEVDRPQPRLDRDSGGGMSVVVGRLRPCNVLDYRLLVLSHNTVRGAAGGTLLNAELLAARGMLPRRSAA